MAIIKPFKALRYHTPRIDNPATVLAPPYDVMSQEQRDMYYDRSEHNIIRVDLPKDTKSGDKYRAAAVLLDEWERSELLVTESKPALYVTEEHFIDGDGYRRVRRGFIAILKVEDFSEGTVFPHEKTFKKHKEDRNRLFNETHAQFNPVFSFYSDPENKIAPVLKTVVDRSLPDVNFKFDDGVTRTMWTLTNPVSIDKIVSAMKPLQVFIADGHHRYETMLEYSRKLDRELGNTGKDMPYQYVLMYLVNIKDEGLSILATHRMFKNLPGFSEEGALEKLNANFTVEKVERNIAMERLREQPAEPVMAAQIGKDYYWLAARPEVLQSNKELQKLHETVRNLNVTVCSQLVYKSLIGDVDNVLDYIGYEIDRDKVDSQVESGQYEMAIYLGPTTIESIEQVARAREVMPQKSTYFYPKLLTGLAIYRFSINNNEAI
jgi:uncharacterized protein (DUF1015 family)